MGKTPQERLEYKREWARRNRDKVAEYNRRTKEKNPEKARAYARKHSRWYRTTEKGKAYRVKAQRKYLTGFTQELWDARLVEQEGLCAICRKAAATRADHNHQTRTPRGILCGRCNSGIGLLTESIEKLEAAIAYIKKWNNG